MRRREQRWWEEERERERGGGRELGHAQKVVEGRGRQRGGKEHKRAYTTVGMWKRIQLMQLIAALAVKRRPRSHFLVIHPS